MDAYLPSWGLRVYHGETANEEDAVGGIVDDVACDDCFHPLDGDEEVDDEPHSKHQRK